LKGNVNIISDADKKLYTLNGYFYRQNKFAEQFGYQDYSREVGLVAQEVQKVLPEVVKIAPVDYAGDIDGVPQSRTGENYLTLHYDRIIALIVETIKIQQKEIDELEQLVDSK